jgi:hypothetical protein
LPSAAPADQRNNEPKQRHGNEDLVQPRINPGAVDVDSGHGVYGEHREVRRETDRMPTRRERLWVDVPRHVLRIKAQGTHYAPGSGRQ